MKTLNLRRMILLIILLSLFSITNESCKKTNAINGQSLQEELTTQATKNTISLPHTKQYSSEVATAWFNLLTDITRVKPYVPGPTLRIFVYSGMALYESVVPGMPSYQSMYKYFTGNTIELNNKKDYYWPACANAAIARIASRIMQNYPAPNLAPLQALESSLNTSFQSKVTAEQLQFSNDFGRYVADIIYDWSKTDGTLNPDGSLAVCPPYVPLGGPGNWVATPPPFLPAVGACQGSLRTFIPNIANTLLPTSHPAYSTDPSSNYHQAAKEVYNISLTLTADSIRLVNNWRDIVGTNFNQPAHTLKLTTGIIKKENVNLEDASVLFAKQTFAAYDAIVAASKAKFYFSLQRPITYIRNVMGFSNWNAVYSTPQLPSYPTYQGLQASSVTILESYFGNSYALIDSVHNALYGSWSYASLNGLLHDIKRSSVMSGTEFQFAIDAGINQGQAVGQLINSLPFKKP